MQIPTVAWLKVKHLAGNQATVTYCVFSAFGGLLKLTDHVDMVSGKILGKTEMEQIVKYDCGVCY